MVHSVSLPKLSPPGPASNPPPELHVTVVIGAAIVAQTAFALIWAGSATERLHQLEQRAGANAAMIERTTRLEEQMRFVSETLERIEVKIDQQADKAS